LIGLAVLVGDFVVLIVLARDVLGPEVLGTDVLVPDVDGPDVLGVFPAITSSSFCLL
jgi:hypothetical protein